MPLFIIIVGLTLVALLHTLLKQYVYLRRYRPIINLDKAIREKNAHKDKIVNQIEELKTGYINLKKEHDVYYDDLEMVSYGHYTPHYNLVNSVSYKNKLTEIRNKQKQLIKNKQAILCGTEWSVSGSKAKGRVMINRTIKLGLNAFNVQSDNTILKVTFSNITNSEERLKRIKDSINKLLQPNHCYITNDFFQLKIQELYLAYEYEEKIQQEKEEQRHIKQQMREEAKALKEMEQAETEAKKEEEIATEALEKARKEVKEITSDQRFVYEARLQELEKKLKEAQEKKERAISMAQQTRKGYVYIISNIGSFGDSIYKIGMTRRLEPLDRVKELGDSSVPFEFDIHAMICTEDAPSLEKKLHESFHNLRVNRINNRKEFFKLNLNEIENKCRELGVENIQFTKLAKAKEYRETLSILNQEQSTSQESEGSTIDKLNEILKKTA